MTKRTKAVPAGETAKVPATARKDGGLPVVSGSGSGAWNDRLAWDERSSVHRERRPERPGRMAGYPTTFGRRRVPTTFV